jgi:sRNA-binding protein
MNRAGTLGPTAIIERFERLWPKCFVLRAARRLPLEIRIGHSAITKGIITVADIKDTLRHYTSAGGCQRNMRSGTGRLDLNGKVASVVTSAEAAHARRILKLRKTAKRANAGLASTKNGHAGRHFAFDPNHKLIGNFAARPAVVRAVPFADTLGEYAEYTPVAS